MACIARAVVLLCAAVALVAAAPVAVADGDGWRWPLDGTPRVTREFSPPASRYAAGHRGVDLAGREGEPVLAAGPGVVAFAGILAGRGVVSVLHRDGRRTTYEPVLPVVHKGQRVAVGDRLGTLQAGHPGCPVAACLHWGVRVGADRYLDPRSLLGGGPVRLLPWWPAGWPGSVPIGAAAPGPAAAGGSHGPGLGRVALAGGAAAAGGLGLAAALGLARRRRRGPG